MKYQFRYVKIKIIAACLIQAAIMVFTLSSCSKDKIKANPLNYEEVPVQVVDSMHVFQYNRDNVKMEMNAPKMERFVYLKDSIQQSYEYFSGGFKVYAYTEEGLLETEIISEGAKHITTEGREQWMAFGNVNIINHIKGEKMETDTIFWNKDEHKIFTKCYVKLSSPQGLMQGYGMETDELARNSVILNPFDSYGVVEQDSTKQYIDIANFIGPMQRF